MSPLLSLTSSPPLFLLAEPLLKPEQFNRILWTKTKGENNIQILPNSPMPLKVAQVGNLEMRLKRGHLLNTPK